MADERGGARKCEGSKGAGWGADRKEHQMRTWVATPFLPQTGTRQAPSASGLNMKALCLYYDAGYCDLALAPVRGREKFFLEILPSPAVLSAGFGAPSPHPHLSSHLHPDNLMIHFQESCELCLPTVQV